MKLLVVFAVFAVLVCASTAIPPQLVYDGPTYELTAISEPTATATDDTSNAAVRQRRVTCDLLSWTSKWLSVNHSACALKCLTQRRRGGRCRDGVCVCR